MIFSADGLINQFLNFLGVSISTSDGYYIAFVTVSALGLAVVTLILTFIFKFIVYIRKG